MVYVRPEDVLAPQQCWQFKEVIENQGESDEAHASDKWSMAAGCWLGNACFTIRLNGGRTKKAGYPVAYGKPAWFVLPTEFNEFIVPTLSQELRSFIPTGSNLICWPSAESIDGEYVAPEDVIPASGRCRMSEVLYNQGESQQGDGKPAKFSIAVGTWRGTHRLLLRWNGVRGTKHARGMPLAGSHPNWFPLPDQLDDPAMTLIPAQERSTAKAWLNPPG